MGDNSGDELAAFFAELGNAMQNSGASTGYINWNSARDASSKVLKEEGDPAVDQSTAAEIQSATELADLWLNEATVFPGAGNKCQVTSRAGWIAGTFKAWQTIVEPVASGLAAAMTAMIPDDIDQASLSIPEEVLSQLPPEIAEQMQQLMNSGGFSEMMKPILDMARTMSATMFGTHLGQQLGVMSTNVLSSSDMGLPLSENTQPAFIGENVKEFCNGLGAARNDAFIYVALREIAHQRLFTHAPWLLTQIQTALATYASQVKVDISKIEEAIGNIDPSDLNNLSDELSIEFALEEPTAEQRAAISRIELIVAFIEGWVTTVVLQAVGSRLPHAVALEETFRRRRAAGGPAERFFNSLIGLQLQPRRIREATIMWQQITDKVGIDQRDHLWTHPDLLPTADDMDDIEGFVQRSSHDLMADLQKAMESDTPPPSEGGQDTSS